MNKRLKELGAIFILGVLLLVFFGPSLTGRTFISTGMLYSDLMSFNYPLKDWYKELLGKGQLPFWTNLLGNGYPVFAEGQIGALYPPHLLLFSFLPTLLAFNLNLFLHFFLAAVGTFVFGRVSLKLSRPASLLAGLAYSFSGFYLTHLHQVNIILVVSYLPLLFLAIERLVVTQKRHWVFVLALVFGLQILAGYIQLFYYTSLASGLFLLLIAFLFPSLKRKVSAKVVVFFGLAFILGVGITAGQLLPTWELTKYSHRAEGLSLEAATAYAWPPEALFLFVNPRARDIYLPQPGFQPLKPGSINFNVLYGYLGIIPLILALVAMVALFRKRFVLIFTIFLFGSFLFGLGRSTQLFAIFWEILPGMKFFRQPIKILFLIDFCLAVLAGFGFDYLGKVLSRKGSLKDHLPFLRGILILLVFVDLYFNNGLRIQPTIDAGEWFTKPAAASFLEKELGDPLFRYYTHGARNLDYGLIRDYQLQKDFQNLLIVDFNLLYRLPSNREWFALFLKRQLELNRGGAGLSVETGSLRLLPKMKKALDLQAVKFLVADLPIDNEDLVLRKEIPFSREVDHYGFFAGPASKTVTVPSRATFIYENQNPFPRVLWAPQARVVESEEEALEAVLAPGFDPRKEVILEESAEGEWAGDDFESTDKEAELKLISDRETETTVEVKTETPGFLVLADTYYPGWQAKVDGEETKIYKANYAFRAVPLKAGQHRVEFVFEPSHWKTGRMISVGALVITLLGLGYCFLRKK